MLFSDLSSKLPLSKSNSILKLAKTEGVVIGTEPSVQVVITLKNDALTKVSLTLSPCFSCLLLGEASSQVSFSILEWCYHYSLGKEISSCPFLGHLNFSSNKKNVVEIIRNIKFGEKMSYEDIAKKLRLENKIKNIIDICHYNDFCLFIPSHRVVGLNSIGGFKFGLTIKEILLRFEKKKFNK